VRGYEQIVASDHASRLFELCSDLTINGIGGRLERDNFQGAKYGLELRSQPSGGLPGRPISEFRRDDDTGADQRLADIADTARDATARVADKIGHDVRVKQVAH
jgi:hypothetical protein